MAPQVVFVHTESVNAVWCNTGRICRFWDVTVCSAAVGGYCYWGC